MIKPSRPKAPPNAHPLDFLPLFRRWPHSHWRNIALTVTWSTIIGLILVGIEAMFSERTSFSGLLLPVAIVSNTVGFVVHGGVTALDRLLGGWPRRQVGVVRATYYLATVSILSIAGIVLGNALLRGRYPWQYVEHIADLAPLLPFAFGMASLMFIFTSASQRGLQADLQMLRQREEIAAAAQLLAEAKLSALQAQIEPHFLYNTLANVLGLIDSAPAQARHMLERFIDFLRASLDASRAGSATAGAELDLAAAYLDVLAIRMGKRLRYRIEADEAARATRIAPMLIQPLVENAVMHGLESKVAGGTVVLRVLRDGAGLLVEVADDGVGIGNAPVRAGGGMGMANIKARALSVHGAGAQLQLLDNPGGGALVRLLLPLAAMESPSTSPLP